MTNPSNPGHSEPLPAIRSLDKLAENLSDEDKGDLYSAALQVYVVGLECGSAIESAKYSSQKESIRKAARNWAHYMQDKANRDVNMPLDVIGRL